METKDFIRTRITELRLKKDVSEHRMSLDLGKSGSYIRGISSGAAVPSLNGLFDIIAYLGVTPAEFFAPLDATDTPYCKLCAKLRGLSDADLEKVDNFLNWIS